MMQVVCDSCGGHQLRLGHADRQSTRGRTRYKHSVHLTDLRLIAIEETDQQYPVVTLVGWLVLGGARFRRGQHKIV